MSLFDRNQGKAKIVCTTGSLSVDEETITPFNLGTIKFMKLFKMTENIFDTLPLIPSPQGRG
jgi:hypothetical protein